MKERDDSFVPCPLRLVIGWKFLLSSGNRLILEYIDVER
jgi:hypothetical protein